jgi:hypothetical protein
MDFSKQGGLGEKLQKLLVERSKTTDNWVKIITLKLEVKKLFSN